MIKKAQIIFTILMLLIPIGAKNIYQPEFVPSEFIIKLSPDTKIIPPGSLNSGIIEIDIILSKISVEDISSVVPFKKNLDPRLPDINRIYRVQYSDNISPDEVAEKFKDLNHVLYSEPRFIQFETTIPNDPYYSSQWHLPVIDASQAWSVTTGDTNVVIAIVDDAIDLDHEDLANNIFTNWVEYHGTEGIDDDLNGYVDDIHGWDFAENDNDPNPVIASQDHGTHVAGCASAVTNNGMGVAAPGWKCKILPLKFSNDSNGSLSGDNAAAIIYAADMGADLTNNSYGGGGYSNYFRDAFSYAYELGTLSLTSAGNSNEDEANYPAAYPTVLSVASTTTGDYKSSFSTYHLSVDISSPGSGIRSSVPDNQYASFSGTSMASPVIAGMAALIRAQNESINARDTVAILRAGAVINSQLNSSVNQNYQANLYNSMILAQNWVGPDTLTGIDQEVAPVINLTALTDAQSLTGSLKLERDSSNDPVIGFYRVLDTSGTVLDALGNEVRPGDANYQSVALSPSNLTNNLDGLALENNSERSIDYSFKGISNGFYLAPYAVTSNNTWFAWSQANSDGQDHFKMLGSNQFGLDDQAGPDRDGDFTDVVMSFFSSEIF